jgi:hypothetical protein
MKSPISKTARVVAFVAAVSMTTLLFYVHAVDRDALGTASAASAVSARIA